MNALYCDIETSGFSPVDGAVPLSVGLVADDGSGIGSQFQELVVHITPTPEQWAKASRQALEVNGLTLGFLQANGLPMDDAVATICEWLLTHGLSGPDIKYVGQNPSFDISFLDHYMGRELEWIGFPLGRLPVNNVLLAKELVRRDKNFRVPNFKSASLSLALGVEPEPAIHNALDGARVVRRNYYALIERLSNYTK